MGKKVIIGLVIVVIVGAYFLYKSYGFRQGIKPVITPPREDISELISVNMPLELPEGFSISIFAKDLKKPRVLIKDPNNTLLVSVAKEGKVVALPDKDSDGVADSIIIVIEGLDRPHGLAFKGSRLYIAETDQVAVYDYDSETFKASNKQKLIDLPGGGNHFTRTLLFNPSDPNELLISVGSTCNVCNEKDWRRAKLLVYDLATGELETFASGLRNAVFIAEHPATKAVWVTEMGRDWLGDDLPPDEINIVEEGKSYGWPLCYGENVPDRDFRSSTTATICNQSEPSFIDIPAHSAPLGLAFFPREGWSKEYSDDLLVAYHGSWNRTVPTGYKIVRYKLDSKGNVLGVADFITGWLEGTEALGRPVDILIESDGVMYISDDKAGVVYRVVYGDDKPEADVITSFKECAEAGYPVMESYPRQCRTLDGELFIEEVGDIFSPCIKTGCSGQICAQEDVFTTCEFLPEYACYRDAVCERQPDGECGWTETSELSECLTGL